MKNKLKIILATFIFAQICLGQSNESLQEKVIEMIKSGQISPSQIREKIAQAGLTEDEAKQLAREKNLDLEQYLKQEQAAKATIESPNESSIKTQLLRTQISPKPIVISVPTFKGRGDAEKLTPYGYDIFQYSPTTFEPVINIPTPENYQVGAGDEIILNVWGQTQLTYQLTITRDGYVVIPDVGKVQIEGFSMQQVRQKFVQQMSRIYEGLRQGEPGANTFLDVSLGKLRSIQVFVMGEAQQPGGYVLSGMSTVFTAIYYAGGPNSNGSLRQLQVIRDDKNIATIDFYDFALYGKKSTDTRLQDGDIVFIPPAGKRIALLGNVLRPAIYELKPEETLSKLFIISGGLQFDAYTKRVHVERVVPFAQRSQYSKDFLDLDVRFNSVEAMLSNAFYLEDGDVVSVFSINQERENLVTITGNVWKAGKYELTPELRVKDLILKADGYREDTFLERAVILRVRQEDLKKEILSFNVSLAMNDEETNNIKLQRLDEVTIYKDDFFNPRYPVTINGAVKKQGVYQRTEDMTVADLIIVAGGSQIGADLSNIEVARLDTTSDQRISKILSVSMQEDYWNSDRSKDLKLQDFDVISVRTKHQFKPTKMVTVKGEAMYPGNYAIQFEGEKLTDLIKRFGGFKSTAYLEGVRFTRSPKIGGIVTHDISSYVSNVLDSLGKPIAIPRRNVSDDVPINMKMILNNPDCKGNLQLQDGDEIIIPRNPGVVYVQGEVNLPSSVPYLEGASLRYYLRQAGDVTDAADEDKTIVVLPNRQKWEPSGFFLFADPEILSGSTIIVPFKAKEKSVTLQILREWASISLSTASVAVLLWQVMK
jgi:protein involved in polysaccharide export with SLBB domain